MATTTPLQRTTSPERRSSIEKYEDEKVETVDVAVLEAAEEDKKAGDYSGFTQKTDPAEIKLVRKLDWYIMVSRPFHHR